MGDDQSDRLLNASGPVEIVQTYRDAAEQMFAQSDENAGFFFLTHAFIQALEAGLPEAEDLEKELRDAHRL
ncbi:MAG: hypothetical protein AAF940_11740 [Pseudomonadota bacterium]